MFDTLPILLVLLGFFLFVHLLSSAPLIPRTSAHTTMPLVSHCTRFHNRSFSWTRFHMVIYITTYHFGLPHDNSAQTAHSLRDSRHYECSKKAIATTEIQKTLSLTTSIHCFLEYLPHLFPWSDKFDESSEVLIDKECMRNSQHT